MGAGCARGVSPPESLLVSPSGVVRAPPLSLGLCLSLWPCCLCFLLTSLPLCPLFCLSVSSTSPLVPAPVSLPLLPPTPQPTPLVCLVLGGSCRQSQQRSPHSVAAAGWADWGRGAWKHKGPLTSDSGAAPRVLQAPLQGSRVLQLVRIAQSHPPMGPRVALQPPWAPATALSPISTCATLCPGPLMPQLQREAKLSPAPVPLPLVTQHLDHIPGWKGPDPPSSQVGKPRPEGICPRSVMEAGEQQGDPRCPHSQLSTPPRSQDLHLPHLGLPGLLCVPQPVAELL